MISNIIVLTSLVFAGLYFLFWLLKSDFRKQVEKPKYRFQEQLNNFEARRQAPAHEDHTHA